MIFIPDPVNDRREIVRFDKLYRSENRDTKIVTGGREEWGEEMIRLLVAYHLSWIRLKRETNYLNLVADDSR